MTGTPDFEAIAKGIVQHVQANQVAGNKKELDAGDLVAISLELRLLWNARGAADLAKIDVELSTMMGSIAAGPYVKGLDRALRKLDR